MKKPLGLNQGRYCGETIDLSVALTEIQALAVNSGWKRQSVCSEPGLDIYAYVRNPSASRRIYLSAGIHGDEPAGPLAVLEMFRRDLWPRSVGLWVVPCLNPSGFARGARENAAGMDLNRQYRNPAAPETQAHLKWLQGCPRFDLALLLHEDWEANGYYLYEIIDNNSASAAPAIIAAVSEVCPIHTDGLVDNWECFGGVIHPNVNRAERPEWPEAIYLAENHTHRTLTLESPSDFALPLRVESHVTALRTLLA